MPRLAISRVSRIRMRQTPFTGEGESADVRASVAWEFRAAVRAEGCARVADRRPVRPAPCPAGTASTIETNIPGRLPADRASARDFPPGGRRPPTPARAAGRNPMPPVPVQPVKTPPGYPPQFPGQQPPYGSLRRTGCPPYGLVAPGHPQAAPARSRRRGPLIAVIAASSSSSWASAPEPSSSGRNSPAPKTRVPLDIAWQKTSTEERLSSGSEPVETYATWLVDEFVVRASTDGVAAYRLSDGTREWTVALPDGARLCTAAVNSSGGRGVIAFGSRRCDQLGVVDLRAGKLASMGTGADTEERGQTASGDPGCGRWRHRGRLRRRGRHDRFRDHRW